MRALLLLLVPLALLPSPLRAASPDASGVGGMPEHRAADASAPAVAPQNLLESERFWPYQVDLVRAWRPAGASEPLAAGTRGVLIRVEDAGLARIDFGRAGLYEVPVAETDLVARANQVRTGALEKEAANFVLAIGPRLLDATSPMLRTLPFREVARYREFLCVFADPGGAGFAELARALAPLGERSGVLTILFAQGRIENGILFEQLRALGWTPAFVHDHLAEAYTQTLLPEPLPLPTLLLQTDEGRVLFQGRWQGALPPALAAALDRPLPGAAARPAGSTGR